MSQVSQFRERLDIPVLRPDGWTTSLNEDYGSDPERPYQATVLTSKWYRPDGSLTNFRADQLIPDTDHIVCGQFIGVVDVRVPLEAGGHVEEVIFMTGATVLLDDSLADIETALGDLVYIRFCDLIGAEKIDFSPMIPGQGFSIPQ